MSSHQSNDIAPFHIQSNRTNSHLTVSHSLFRSANHDTVMSSQQEPKRRRPPPKRGRPGAKRPRTVFSLDDVTTMAPPEATMEGEEEQPISESLSPNSLQEKQATDEADDSSESESHCEHFTDDSDDEDLDGNTTQSGPWWTWAENQHALEDWVMGKLDKMITRAERAEERKLMNYYDERILMHQLLHNIEKTESQENDNSGNENEGDNGDELDSSSSSSSQSAWEMEETSGTETDQSSGEKAPNEISPEPEPPEESQPCATSTTPMVVEFEKKQDDSMSPSLDKKRKAIETTARPSEIAPVTNDPPGLIRRALPKWIGNSNVRLFTPKEFDSYVIQPLLCKLPSCKLKLLDDCPGDKNSYLLEAKLGKTTGETAMEDLKATTEAFLRSRISGANLKSLLEDGASLELDLQLNIHEPMGVRFSRFTLVGTTSRAAASETADRPPGLWINRVEPSKGLANALGSHEAFLNGCALLTANGRTIGDPLDLRELLLKTKQNSAASSVLKVKICLSKHADLTGIPLSKLMQKHFLKRRDGKPIDFGSYRIQQEKDSENATASESKTPSKAASNSLPDANLGNKGNNPAPKPSKTLVHPSFPQHLQTPSETAGESSEKGTKEGTKPLQTATTTSKELVHPAYRSFERGDKSAKNDRKETTKRSQGTTTSKELVHPAFRKRNESTEKADKERKANVPSEATTSKELVHPAFRKPSKPQATDKDNNERKTPSQAASKELVHPSIRKSLEKSKGVRVVTADSTMLEKAKDAPAIEPQEHNTTNESNSDMSISDSSNINSQPKKTTSVVPNGNKSFSAAISNQNANTSKPTDRSTSVNGASNGNNKKRAKDSAPTKLVNSDRVSTSIAPVNSRVATQSNSTSEKDSGIARDKEKSLPKPLNDTVGAKVSTNTKINGSLKNAMKNGKESLHKPMSNGNREKTNEAKSQNQAFTQKSTVVNNVSCSRVEEGTISDLSDDVEDKQGVPKASTKRTENNGGINTTRRNSVTNSSHQQKGSAGIPSAPHHKRFNAPPSFRPFEVTLDARRPLGGFFRTERGQNFQSKCVILSMCPGGQLHLDSRIKVGTQVTAVMIGERRMEVTSHTDVKIWYSEANQHRKNIRLILLNNHSCKIEPAHLTNSNWASNGDWIGNMKIGWPGKLPKSDWDSVGPMQRRRSQQPEGSFSPRVGSFSPTHDQQESSSLEKPFCSPRLGSFSPIATMEEPEQRPNARLLHGELDFAHAIRNKSWTDLIDVMERGPDFSKDFVQHVLKKQYSYVDAELKKIDAESDAGTNGFQLTMWERLDQDRKKQLEAEKKQDLEAKKKILKIYINSVYLVEKAMTLRNWNEVIIEVKNLQLFHLPSKFDPHRSKAISTKVRRTSPDVHLCNIPAVSIQHRISYSSKNVLSLHNNHMAALEDRKLVVEISEGDPKVDPVQPKKLGQFVLAMNEIESQCPSDGGWNYREKRSDGFGSIGLSMKRQAASHAYCGSKRQDILHHFKTQLEAIERFNSENYNSATNSSKLTPNLCGLFGISLLYAAIEVMADFQLVQKMLSLGADPKRPPHKSPLDLARKQYDRCKAKEQNAPQEFRTACAQKSAEAKRLLDALEAASK